MSQFLRLLTESDKAAALQSVCTQLRQGEAEHRAFDVEPEAFDAVPGRSFAYWVSDLVRASFSEYESFEADGWEVKQGLSTADDKRFVRLFWELNSSSGRWFPFAKGGAYGRFYSDVYLIVKWESDGIEIKESLRVRYPYLGGSINFVARNTQHYFRAGLTWPRRTTSGLSVRCMPSDCIFGDKGPAAFLAGALPSDYLARLAIANSAPFSTLVSLQLAAADAAARSYEVGVIQTTPVPTLTSPEKMILGNLARRAWSLKRTLDSVVETSHVFTLPAVLRNRLNDYDPAVIEEELVRIQSEIDDISFDLYGFNEGDRAAAQGNQGAANDGDGGGGSDDEGDDEDGAAPIDLATGLLSWAVGVAFGRFDWRLATGERAAPAEPEPFDPLPAKSPGMLLEGATPFHAHSGILVDDPGHPHDLARLIEEVLFRVEESVPEDVRRWLQRDFFPFHLQRYSKSRRKAPIYWPLSTPSGSYTLWVYYPSLTSQTLYTAINDFVEPKLKQVAADLSALRNKGASRTRDDEKQFESLQGLASELAELRDTLLQIAPTYKPNHDDGVQISAAPLSPLFRHKPWQKVLKDTWAKLEKGDYDWAHLAMNYWPERVRDKCKHDKSLAIAHDLEALYIEPPAKPKKAGGRKKKR